MRGRGVGNERERSWEGEGEELGMRGRAVGNERESSWE